LHHQEIVTVKPLPRILATTLLGVALMSQAAQPASPTDEATTRAVLEHHWKTFQGNDLDGVMADYTEDSVLITPGRTYKGLKEIRDNFISAFDVYPHATTAMQLNKSIVQRDIGYILWEATAPKLRLSFGTDTFIVRNGKIISQTYAGVSTPR
jgi:hypothetical protein